MKNKSKIFAALSFIVLFGLSCEECQWLYSEQEKINREQLQTKKAQEQQVNVSVLWLGEGENRLAFPTNQFVVVPGGRTCSAPYYIASRDAYTLEGEKVVKSIFPVPNQIRTNPDPNGCGFGRVSDITRQVIAVPQSNVDNYQGPPFTPVTPGNQNQAEIRTEGGGNLIGQ